MSQHEGESQVASQSDDLFVGLGNSALTLFKELRPALRVDSEALGAGRDWGCVADPMVTMCFVAMQHKPSRKLAETCDKVLAEIIDTVVDLLAKGDICDALTRLSDISRLRLFGYAKANRSREEASLILGWITPSFEATKEGGDR